MTAPQVLELPLDDALLKVLSSESRREILRLLAERRMTGAEMAGRLNLGKPAVSEHLKKLTEAGLIERADDPERRWVYYNLSSRGRSILEPQRVRFYLVMAVATLALVLGMALALGFAVFLQQGDGAAGPAASMPESGQSYLGSDAYQPPSRGASVPAAPTTASVPALSDPPVESKVAAVTVVTVPHKICPVGRTCTEPAETDAATAAEDEAPSAFVLVLPNGQIAPPPATTVVYAFQAQDVDATLNTITVHPIDAAAVGDVAADLGVPDADLATLASMAGAITLRSGGTLLPVADDVELPVVQFDAADQADALALTLSLAPAPSAPVRFSEPVDESSMQASDRTDGAPQGSFAASTDAAASDEASADGSSSSGTPSEAAPASATEPVEPAQAGPSDASTAAASDAAPAAASQDDASPPATATTPPATAPPADTPQAAAPATTDGAASKPIIDTAAPASDTPVAPGATSASGDGAVASVDAAQPASGAARGASPFVAPATDRQPSDSPVLPFVAILGAALLFGLQRRRSA